MFCFTDIWPLDSGLSLFFLSRRLYSCCRPCVTPFSPDSLCNNDKASVRSEELLCLGDLVDDSHIGDLLCFFTMAVYHGISCPGISFAYTEEFCDNCVFYYETRCINILHSTVNILHSTVCCFYRMPRIAKRLSQFALSVSLSSLRCLF